MTFPWPGPAGSHRGIDLPIPKTRATLVRPRSAQNRGNQPASGGESPAIEALLASRADPLLTCESILTTRNRYLQGLSSPLTDSNRRPPPYHGGFALRLTSVGIALAKPFSLHPRLFRRATPQLPRRPPSRPQNPRACPQNPSPKTARLLSLVARSGVCNARSRCIQLFQRREAKYRVDPLESIVEISNRLIRANDDRVRLVRHLGLLHASFVCHLHQFAALTRWPSASHRNERLPIQRAVSAVA
jgi:hypothetical protein